MKIGLTYVKGSVPGLENFGNLPTDLIKSNGLLNGNPISKELDGLIIPGGSILESKSISDDFKREIKIMAKEGKPIIGICAGYQLLSNQLDITNPNHPNLNYTIENPNLNEDNLKNGSLNKDNLKEGLGLLDVNFSYLFSNDKVESKVSSKSYLTKGLETVKGFHCHIGSSINQAKSFSETAKVMLPFLKDMEEILEYAEILKRQNIYDFAMLETEFLRRLNSDSLNVFLNDIKIIFLSVSIATTS